MINWIQGHVDKNSLVDLTPVFDDYKNHMINLKNRHGIQPKKLVQVNILDTVQGTGPDKHCVQPKKLVQVHIVYSLRNCFR